MAENETAFQADGALEGLNSTVNGTTGAAASGGIWHTLTDVNFILLELQLVFGAIGIIYVGAHAALRRPPSAAKAKPRKPGEGRRGRDDDEERITPGMELSDAIMFPLLAGTMLIGLYYLIQWLKDPNLLNKILRWYMSAMSIFSVLTLYAHGMDIATSFTFPHYWRARDGSLRMADQKLRLVWVCDDVGNPLQGRDPSSNPLPGPLSLLAFSDRSRKAAWDLRELLVQHWRLRLYARGMGEEKANINFSHVLALVLSVATTIAYFATNSSFLSNVLGYGLCYGSALLLSPTDLMIGSLVMGGLFVYDIVMVFYTPYMVTVATKLDVPIKLTFKAAERQSILGLGDIVLPGMLMGWALRLDLWMHYRRKLKYEATDLKVVEKDTATGDIVTRSETKHKEVKAPYVNAKGLWGDSFWTRKGPFFSLPELLPSDLSATYFPKPYFYATIIGYLLGMLVTLAMLLVFKRGQPALLYLVPGVLGSLYLTAFARGEFKDIWSYTEDGSIDKVDVVVDLDGNGRELKRIGKLENGIVDTTKDENSDKEKNKDSKAAPNDADKKPSELSASEAKPHARRHQIISLSLEDTSEDP